MRLITISSKVAPLPLSPAHPPPPPAKCDAHKCPWWPYSSSKEFKANTAMVIVVLFCGLMCALAFNAGIRYLIRWHFRRQRQRSEQQPGNEDVEVANQKASVDGGAAAEVETLVVVYSAGMKLAGTEAECAICLSEFSEGEKIKVLEKCNHGFHVKCIRRWLVSHTSCPTCRTNCSFKTSSCSQ